MRIAVITDAWSPQVNGVVRTLQTTIAQLRTLGHEVMPITPGEFRTVPCPSYPEIRLALASGRAVARRLDDGAPDAVHIATEGPLGWGARRWCLDRDRPFTTSFHTRFPDYLSMRTGLPPALFWGPVRRFHRPAARIFVATGTLERELRAQGLQQGHRWSRGVDLALFRPDGALLPEMAALPRPIILHVGRIAPEKNIDAFFAADVPGTRVVVGDGPLLPPLKARWPAVHFLGALHGERLAAAYRTADVLAFASRTDTFGLVMIEANASGTPAAAFPVPGPIDVLTPATGVLHDDLGQAIMAALPLDRAACAAAARAFDWERCTEQFLNGLAWPRDTASADPAPASRDLAALVN